MEEYVILFPKNPDEFPKTVCKLVRCKDCKHYDNDNEEGYCNLLRIRQYDKDFYCKKGVES